MKINMQFIHFSAKQPLVNFVYEKVNKLTHYYEDIIISEVILKVDSSHSKLNKVCEIKLEVPGNDLFASSSYCKSFEEAVVHTIDSLKHQIDKRKAQLIY